jgi:hypothetical protein
MQETVVACYMILIVNSMKWPNSKTTQPRLNGNTQRSHIQNNKERTEPEAKAVHRIAATAATLPSHTRRWPVRPKHVVRYNEESDFQ